MTRKSSVVLIIVPMVDALAFDARWYQTNPVDFRNLSQIPIVQEIPRGGSGHPLISYRVAQIFYHEIMSKVDFWIDLHSEDLFLDLIDLTFYRKMGSNPQKDHAALALARNFG